MHWALRNAPPTSLCHLQADRFARFRTRTKAVERLFSRAGNLYDANMDPHFLAAMSP